MSPKHDEPAPNPPEKDKPRKKHRKNGGPMDVISHIFSRNKDPDFMGMVAEAFMATPEERKIILERRRERMAAKGEADPSSHEHGHKKRRRRRRRRRRSPSLDSKETLTTLTFETYDSDEDRKSRRTSRSEPRGQSAKPRDFVDEFEHKSRTRPHDFVDEFEHRSRRRNTRPNSPSRSYGSRFPEKLSTASHEDYDSLIEQMRDHAIRKEFLRQTKDELDDLNNPRGDQRPERTAAMSPRLSEIAEESQDGSTPRASRAFPTPLSFTSRISREARSLEEPTQAPRASRAVPPRSSFTSRVSTETESLKEPEPVRAPRLSRQPSIGSMPGAFPTMGLHGAADEVAAGEYCHSGSDFEDSDSDTDSSDEEDAPLPRGRPVMDRTLGRGDSILSNADDELSTGRRSSQTASSQASSSIFDLTESEFRQKVAALSDADRRAVEAVLFGTTRQVPVQSELSYSTSQETLTQEEPTTPRPHRPTPSSQEPFVLRPRKRQSTYQPPTAATVTDAEDTAARTQRFVDMERDRLRHKKVVKDPFLYMDSGHGDRSDRRRRENVLRDPFAYLNSEQGSSHDSDDDAYYDSVEEPSTPTNKTSRREHNTPTNKDNQQEPSTPANEVNRQEPSTPTNRDSRREPSMPRAAPARASTNSSSSSSCASTRYSSSHYASAPPSSATNYRHKPRRSEHLSQLPDLRPGRPDSNDSSRRRVLPPGYVDPQEDVDLPRSSVFNGIRDSELLPSESVSRMHSMRIYLAQQRGSRLT